MTIYGRSEELVSRCVECDLAEPESLASLGGSAPGLVDGILSHHRRTATARQLDRPCECLAIPEKNEIKMRTEIYQCQHFEMTIVMQCTYFGSHCVVI